MVVQARGKNYTPLRHIQLMNEIVRAKMTSSYARSQLSTLMS